MSEKKLDAPTKKVSSSDLAKRARSIRMIPGTPYYFITSGMTVEVSEWLGTKLDNQKRNSGNFFIDKETATIFAEKIMKFLNQHNSQEK